MLGQATILLLISQVVFLISGYAINVGLARMLGPEGFGTFGVVMSFLFVAHLFVITGIPIALQKFVAENIDASRLLVRKTLPMHLLNSLAFFILFWLISPLIASWFDDPSLEFYLKIASFDIIFYGLYKYYQSLQNGLHQFGRQTLGAIAYAVAKPLSIFALVLSGFSITGAVLGNTLGALGGWLGGLLLVKMPEIKAKLEEIQFFRFAFINVFYYVGLQLLFSVDIWFVKYHLSDVEVGQYVSASSMAKIPYFLSLAISSALMPVISRATKEGDEKRVRDVTAITLRYWLMLLFAMIVVIGATATPLMNLFFGEQYTAAGPILAVLFAGIALVTFFAVMNTILIMREQLKSCLIGTGSLIILHVAANAILVPKLHGRGAALATLIVGAVGIVVVGTLLLRNVRVVMPPLSAARTVLSAAAVLALAYYIPILDHYLIAKCAFLLMLFVAGLFLIQELKPADVKRVQEIVATKNQH